MNLPRISIHYHAQVVSFIEHGLFCRLGNVLSVEIPVHTNCIKRYVLYYDLDTILILKTYLAVHSLNFQLQPKLLMP